MALANRQSARTTPIVLAAILSLGLLTAEAADIARPSTSAGSAAASAATAPAVNSAGVPQPALPNAQIRLTAARDAIAAVRAMQTSAANLARQTLAAQKTGANSWNVSSDPKNPVVVTSGLSANGLVPDNGGMQFVDNGTGLFLVPTTWSGVDTLTQTVTSGTSPTTNVVVHQNSQQAILNWQKFNIAPDTQLYFDQTAGGASVANWIAFNKIGVLGSPSQILGGIKADGQVYVINPNGILFGGTSQVNTRSLVASSLPINDNLIQRGLLNNPDSQFLFSGLALSAGASTPAFQPSMSETVNASATNSGSYTTTRTVADPSSVSVSYIPAGGTSTPLVAATDYVVSTVPASNGLSGASVVLTSAGVLKVSGQSLQVTYTPTADNFGNVVVQPGAIIATTTTPEHVGGRVMLVGPNVTNAGTLTSPDGQVILAAGLQVGVSAHALDTIQQSVEKSPGQTPPSTALPSSDPSLRGLDVFVGKVSFDGASTNYSAGVVTNDHLLYADGSSVSGLLETTDIYQTNIDGTPADPVDVPGSIVMAGKTVNQLGVINSLTTVSFNGRVDLLANYNASSNLNYTAENIPSGSLPFDYTTDAANTGVLTLGASSLIQIMPSDSLTDKVNSTQELGLSLRSTVNLVGNAIHLAGSATGNANDSTATGAIVRAPNANTNLLAGTWQVLDSGQPTQRNQMEFAGGQVYLDKGATIDVSGTQGATASVTENVVQAQLRGPELANSPLQRDGPLRGQTIDVDLRVHGPWDPATKSYAWVGTPVGDVSGYVNLVQRTAGELTTNGGNVNLLAGGSVVQQAGSSIDVSGGWIDYQPGHIQTTQVISGGHLYDISQATPNRIYDGIFNGSTGSLDPKWGITQTSTNQTLLGYDDPGYIQGGAGGKLMITAPSAALDGGMAGQTYKGSRQVLTAPQAGSIDFVPKPSEFDLRFEAQTLDQTLISYSPTTPNVAFTDASTQAQDSPVPAFKVDSAGAYALSKARQNQVDLSADLVNRDGFGFILVDASDDNFGIGGRANSTLTYGLITVDANTLAGNKSLLNFDSASALATFLNQRDGSSLASLNLLGTNIDIEGSVTSPGGIINFGAPVVSGSYAAGTLRNLSLFPAISTRQYNRGNLTLGAKAELNVSGEVIDQRQANTSSDVRAFQGGSISLKGFDTTVDDGAVADVSGAAMIGANRSVSWGGAGTLSIQALNNFINGDDNQLILGAALALPSSYTLGDDHFAPRGYSGSGMGGTFDITGGYIQIGGTAVTKNSLVLDQSFFGAGGFANYQIVGQPGLTPKLLGTANPLYPDVPSLWIAPSLVTPKHSSSPVITPTTVTIAPKPQAFQINFAQTGSDALQIFSPRDAFQSPVNIALIARGASSGNLIPGNLVLEQNANFSFTPNANSAFSLQGDSVEFLGSVSVPGGSIALADVGSSRDVLGGQAGTVPVVSVYLGSKSKLSVAGAPLTSIDNRGDIIGTILDGKSISVSGNIVAEAGAIIDASGATGFLDLSPFQTAGSYTAITDASAPVYVRRSVDSNGGSIKLSGGEVLFSDATLLAKAGGPTAEGGTLTVASGIFNPLLVNDPTIPTLKLTAEDLTIPVPFDPTAANPIAQTVVDTKGNAVSSNIFANTDYFGGAVATSSFNKGGFASLVFSGTIQYSGEVALNASRSVTIGTQTQSGGALVADAAVSSSLSISAPYVSLGLAFPQPGNTTTVANSTSGSGTLSVSGAKLIDIGDLSLLGINEADLTTVAGGDVRGAGTFEMHGALNITAGQIYPPTASTLTLAVLNTTDSHGVEVDGSIDIEKTGQPSQVPLSAGGQLNLYASTIIQNGVLRAPVGQINLGLDPAATISGKSYPLSKSVLLGQGSVISVSTLDLATGKPLSVPIPYGNNLNGTSWIDPTGTDITINDPAGRLVKRVSLQAGDVEDQAGSTIDVAGGGDLYAYRFVPGTNGRADILSNTTSFAVLPDYTAGYAPYGAFNQGVSAQSNLSGDAGYISVDPRTGKANLQVGDTLRIDLNPSGSDGFQNYTLLPAKYALLPGAYLVTPEATVPSGTVVQPDGSFITTGFRYNALNSSRLLNTVYTSWEVAPGEPATSSAPASAASTSSKAVDVVRLRAEYDNFSANTFFLQEALANSRALPRTPLDGGQLVFAPTTEISIDGKVDAQPVLGPDGKPAKNADGTQTGRGGLVDIGSPLDILIAGPNTDLTDTSNQLVLDTAKLNSFGAESLLIGGVRSTSSTGTTVAVTTDFVEVDNGPALNANGFVTNPGMSLTGSDITLVANRAVAVLPGSSIVQSGTLPNGADNLKFTGTAKLQPGETVTFANVGVPISFPTGTGVDTTAGIVPNLGGTYTTAGGTPVAFNAGDTVVLPPNSVLSLDASKGAAGAIPSITVANTTNSVAMQSGDGAVIRVSSDPNALVTRSPVVLSGFTDGGLPLPGAFVFQNTQVSGGTGSLIVDSTNQTTIQNGAQIGGASVSLSSRRVGLAFDTTLNAPGSLLLTADELAQLQSAGTNALNLTSYSSIDLYGSGALGSKTLQTLTLHTPQILNQNGGNVTFTANSISLDNSVSGTPDSTLSGTAKGSLNLNAAAAGAKPGIVYFGSSDAAGNVKLARFTQVNINAESGVVFGGTGGYVAQGSADGSTTAQLTVTAPKVTALAGAAQGLQSDGALVFAGTSTVATKPPEAGLGATLNLKGSSVALGNDFSLPSGNLKIEATQGDISVSGNLDASGQARTIVDAVRYTSGGQINLVSDHGEVKIGSSGVLNVSAPLRTDLPNNTTAHLGNAGTISVQAADPQTGQFVFSEGAKFLGAGGLTSSTDNALSPGESGTFLLDVGTLDPAQKSINLAPLNLALNEGGFNQDREFRVRTGSVVLDGLSTSHLFAVSADSGNITVSGAIDASGSQLLTVDNSGKTGPQINVAGQSSDAFGNHGGTINLQARGSVTLQSGASLSVAASDYNDAGQAGSVLLSAGTSQNGTPGTASAKVDIQGQQNGLPAAKIDLSIGTPTVRLNEGESYILTTAIPSENLLSADTSGKIFYANGEIQSFLAGAYLPPLPAQTTIKLDAAGALNLAGGTLHLRSPQTFDAVNPGVQIQVAAANESIVGAGRVIVEGYKIYAPVGGYIDSVRLDVDSDGALFAGQNNADKIVNDTGLTQLTGYKNLVHVQPGVEIDSPTIKNPTATSLTFAAPGNNSNVQVASGATVFLPSTTNLALGPSTNNITFGADVNLVPTAAATFTESLALQHSTTLSTEQVSVTPTAKITVTSTTVAANSFTSTVAVVATPLNGPKVTYAAGTPIPDVLLKNTTLTFSGVGTFAANTSATVLSRFTLSDVAPAGISTHLPAQTVVALTTDGGSVTFNKAGSLTWTSSAPNSNNTLALQFSTAGSYALGSSPAAISIGSGVGATNFQLTSSAGSLQGAAGTTYILPLGFTSQTAKLTASGASAGSPMNLSLTSASGTVVGLNAGDTINVPAGSKVLDPTTSVTSDDTVGLSFDANGGLIIFQTLSTNATETIQLTASSPAVIGRLETNGASVPVMANQPLLVTAGTKLYINSAATVKVLAPDVDTSSSASVAVFDNLAAGSMTLSAAQNIYLPSSLTKLQLTAKGPISLSTSSVLYTNVGPVSITAANAQTNLSLSKGANLVVSVQDGTSLTASGASVVTSKVGDLLLGSTWDLSTSRFGAAANPDASGAIVEGAGEPGFLTIRAGGNLIFDGSNPAAKASLSDGFGLSPSATNGGLWQAPLLPAGSQSWSFDLVAGSDFSAADPLRVMPLSQIAANSGSFILGQGTGPLPVVTNEQTGVPKSFQTIRTGTGNIAIAAARDVSIQNSIASIYTAGTQVRSPSSLLSADDFAIPATVYKSNNTTGPVQEFSNPYPVQYSYGGGNVTISAGNDILHQVLNPITNQLVSDSAKELPTSWLYRSGYVDPSTGQFGLVTYEDSQNNLGSQIGSTSWWVDFSNFFEGVGALGGGNVALSATHNISNVDAVVPTNARTTNHTSASTLAAQQSVVELGGGNLKVETGHDLDAGVYYVEHGNGSISVGGKVVTNATRSTNPAAQNSSPQTSGELPTTLFVGDAGINITAVGDALFGWVANPFWLPQGINNSYYERTVFDTYTNNSSVNLSSLAGNITLAEQTGNADGSLNSWYENIFSTGGPANALGTQPWLKLNVNSAHTSVLNVLPGNIAPPVMKVAAFSGSISLIGNLTLAPSAFGTLELLAQTSLNGVGLDAGTWISSSLDVSDADPKKLPGVLAPLGVITDSGATNPANPDNPLSPVQQLFQESGATSGNNVVLQTKQTLHGKNPDSTAAADQQALHGNDTAPLLLYADQGDISGIQLFAPKAADITAGRDITDIGLYLQNARSDIPSVVTAGRDVVAYDPNSVLRTAAFAAGAIPTDLAAEPGDIQISGPGALNVFAGRNLDLGNPIASAGGLGVGIDSIGNTRNSYLPFAGADVVVGAGVGPDTNLTALNFTDQNYHAGFIDQFLNPTTGGAIAQEHLPELGALLGFTIDAKNPESQNAAIWSAFSNSAKYTSSQRDALALQVFYDVLRDAGRAHNNPDSSGFRKYTEGYDAVATLFNSGYDLSSFISQFITTTDTSRSSLFLPEISNLLALKSGTSNADVLTAFTALPKADRNRIAAQMFADALRDAVPGSSAPAGAFTSSDVVNTLYASPSTTGLWSGDISLSSREIRTINGGNISVFDPSGGLSLGHSIQSAGLTPPGIITQFGGNISIFTQQSVDVGVSRIFTLRGGNIDIWSTLGNIAAGSSSKTVQSAPPTRVLVDPQSASVDTDLAGLATGGGIGVLATVTGILPGDVDLVAPSGTVDAGDAGIRATGNLNIAAVSVLNAANIQVGGTSTGTPPAPPPVNVGGLTSAASSASAANSAATEAAKQNTASSQAAATPSLISVEVLGYGGPEDDSIDPSSMSPDDSSAPIGAISPDVPSVDEDQSTSEETKRKRRAAEKPATDESSESKIH